MVHGLQYQCMTESQTDGHGDRHTNDSSSHSYTMLMYCKKE